MDLSVLAGFAFAGFIQSEPVRLVTGDAPPPSPPVTDIPTSAFPWWIVGLIAALFGAAALLVAIRRVLFQRDPDGMTARTLSRKLGLSPTHRATIERLASTRAGVTPLDLLTNVKLLSDCGVMGLARATSDAERRAITQVCEVLGVSGGVLEPSATPVSVLRLDKRPRKR